MSVTHVKTFGVIDILQVYDQLTELARKYHNNIEPEVFEEFCKKHPGVLFPAFVVRGLRGL